MDEYIHAEESAELGAPLLILLHGTGGDERDLLDLGRLLMPGARLIAPRGDVSENGMPRFFRRLGMGVYDIADFERATRKLTAFIATQKERHASASVAALGYSNGANILASVLFRAPQLVDRAVLLHPLIPFAPPAQPGLAGKRLLIGAGRRDPIATARSDGGAATIISGRRARMSRSRGTMGDTRCGRKRSRRPRRSSKHEAGHYGGSVRLHVVPSPEPATAEVSRRSAAPGEEITRKEAEATGLAGDKN